MLKMTNAELKKLKMMTDEELNEFFMSKFTFLSSGYVGLYRKVKYKGKLVPLYRYAEKSIRKYVDKCNVARRYITYVYKMLGKRNIGKNKIFIYVSSKVGRAHTTLSLVLRRMLTYEAVLSKYPKYLRKCSVEDVNKYFIDKFIAEDLILGPKKKYIFDGREKEFRQQIPMSPSERRMSMEKLKEEMYELTKVYRSLGFIHSARSHIAEETVIYKNISECPPYRRLLTRYCTHRVSESGRNSVCTPKEPAVHRYNQRFYDNFRKLEGRDTSDIQFFSKQERKVANAKKKID